MQNAQVCTTREQLTDLEPSWDRLHTFLDAPFGKFPWILSCAEAFTADSHLYIQVVRKDRTPVAVAPLVKPDGFFAVARQLGVGDHGEPGDFAYLDTESLDFLTESLAGSNVPMFLARVPADSPVVAALERAYRRRGFVIVRPQANCPFIGIEATEDQTLAQLPARLRSDLRRARRKAEEIGPVLVEAHAPSTAGDLAPLWEESLKIEAAGWKGRSRTALELDHRVGSFYRAYAIRAAELGILRILFLRIGDEITATMIALEAGGRFWILKIGYDERFAKCSPGMLLMHEALSLAARRGLRSYEFLGTATDWTRRWTDNERRVLRVYVYPFTVRGMTILARDAAIHLWYKARRRLRGR